MSATPEAQPGSPAPALDRDHEDHAAEHVLREDTHHEDEEGGNFAAKDGQEESRGDDADLSDDESVLSEVDEAQFEDFNPDDVAIEDRPALAIDEENLKLIGRHKRKRRGDEEDEDHPKKKKEGRREKKSRRQRDSESADADGRRSRKKDRAQRRREATPEDEELLDPATSEFLIV